MIAYLSAEWIVALGTAVAANTSLSRLGADTGADLTVQYTVTTDGSEPVTYWVRFDRGANSVGAGAAADPDVTIATDRATATAVATGSLSAQAAFMAGQLRIGGDTAALLANRALLAGIEDVAGTLRAETTFDEPAGDHARTA